MLNVLNILFSLFLLTSSCGYGENSQAVADGFLQDTEFQEKGKAPFLSEQYYINNQLDPLWQHTLVKIYEDCSHIELENGTIWSIGWWWKSEVKKWNVGDVILIDYHLGFEQLFANPVLFQNISKNATAWGPFQPQYKASSQVVYVVAIEEHQSVLILNDGSRIRAPFSYGIFHNYQVGDILLAFSVVDSSIDIWTPYAIWNLFENSIVFNLEVER